MERRENLKNDNMLPEAIGEIRSKAGDEAEIFVFGYPSPVANLTQDYNEFTVQEAYKINQWAEHLNCTIEEVVTCMDDPKLFFVPVAEMFVGHEYGGEKDPWINPVKIFNKTESFHPNVLGHKAYAKALQSKIINKGAPSQCMICDFEVNSLISDNSNTLKSLSQTLSFYWQSNNSNESI